MLTTISELLEAIKQENAQFSDVLHLIDTHYEFTPTAFDNGSTHNAVNENSGSFRVFSFAQLHQLSELDTLHLFAEHYRAVRANPAGTDHQNIRNFAQYGWSGIVFHGQALKEKIASS
jgi:HopJ type III effector protein